MDVVELETEAGAEALDLAARGRVVARIDDAEPP
jgi:hypothetical protein